MKNGLVAGSFDLLHPGHLILLGTCVENCDHLYICLQTDPTIDRPEKNKPIQTIFERWLQLQYCSPVSLNNVTIIPYDTEKDLYNILAYYPIDIRFLGDDYLEKETFTGKELDIPEYYIDRSHSYSSSELRNRIKTSWD